MKSVLLAASLIFSANALATEKSYFYCTGDSAEIQSLIIKQIITSSGSTISSTFRADVTNSAGVVTSFSQDGDVLIGSDDTFKGPFRAGHHLAEIDINARDSTFTEGSVIHHMNCNSL